MVLPFWAEAFAALCIHGRRKVHLPAGLLRFWSGSLEPVSWPSSQPRFTLVHGHPPHPTALSGSRGPLPGGSPPLSSSLPSGLGAASPWGLPAPLPAGSCLIHRVLRTAHLQGPGTGFHSRLGFRAAPVLGEVWSPATPLLTRGHF